MEAILALGVVAGIMGVFVGAQFAFQADTKHVDRRLAQYGARHLDLGEMAHEQRTAEQATKKLAEGVERAFGGRGIARGLQTQLARANLKLTVGEFLMIRAALTFALGALAWLMSGPAAGLFFTFVGWQAPMIWIGRRQAARLKKFNEQLPDTITLISNSLRSGLSLVQSMEMVAREGEPPIAEEFSRVVREIALGVGPQDSLRHLVRRVDSEDLDLMVTAILVQFEVGGNLARILDTIAHTIRERVKIKGEIKTLTAQQRGSAIMLSMMPVVLAGIFLLIAPNYVGKLFKFPYAILPILAACGVGFGFFLLSKITDIEV
jgi:tight adherence protein B